MASLDQPNIIPDLQSPEERLLELKKELEEVLSFRVEIENLVNIDETLDAILEKVTSLTTRASDIYREVDPEITSKQILEDRALAQIGLTNVPYVLDKISQIKNIFDVKIQKIIQKKVEAIITPPDEGREVKRGIGESPWKEKETISRLKMLLYILLSNCGLEEKDIDIRVGSVGETQMRKEPYISVFVKDLNRLVIVCDEEGNRTDIFDTEHDEYKKEGRESIEQLTKDEKNKYAEMYPGSSVQVVYSKKWADRIYTHLTEPIPQLKEKVEIIERPKDLVEYPKADPETGFYTDENGEKWGAVTRILINFEIEPRRVPYVKRLLSANGIESKKVNSQGKTHEFYSVSLVEIVLKNDSETGAYFRKANENGIYTDPQGREWASLNVIAGLLEIGPNNKRLINIVRDFTGQKIQCFRQCPLAYDISVVKEKVKKDEELGRFFRRADDNGYYYDESGERWTSKSILEDRFDIRQNPIFIDLLKKLESIRIISGAHDVDAYKVSNVLLNIKNDINLSGFLRRPDQGRFYVDEKGEKWGTTADLSVELGISSRRIFGLINNVGLASQTIKLHRLEHAYPFFKVLDAMLQNEKLKPYAEKYLEKQNGGGI